MSSYQWALLFHLIGVFAFVSGALVLETAAVRARREGRSGEIATLLGVSRIGEHAANAGGVVLFAFAFWLVHLTPYGFGDAWIVAALTLFVLQGLPVNLVVKRRKRAKALADELAAGGSPVSPELRRLLDDRATIRLAYVAHLITVAIIVLMVWKPGA